MSLRDPDAANRANLRQRVGYTTPVRDERMRRRPSEGPHGVVRFFIFALVLATIVLVGLVTIGRPLLAAGVVGWASDNPSALNIPFVADLMRDDLGDKLTTPASTDATRLEFTISDGDTTQGIARNLARAHVITDSRVFVYTVHATNPDATWTTGRYFLAANQTPQDIYQTLQEGPPPNPTITIGLREGLRLEQVTALLEKLHNDQGLEMDPKDFYDTVTKPPADLLDEYPWIHLPSGASLEGFLAPATYIVQPDISAEDFVRKLLDHFYESVGTDRLNVAKARGLSFYQVLTIASIVEQEAVVDDERPIIAGVYQNRLTKKMPLGADPTVIYGYDTGQLRNTPFDQWVQYYFWAVPKQFSGMAQVPVPDDLVGYQTYNQGGLPPGPICTPTVASIDAALDPNTKAGYYYFVAIRDASGKTTGRHAFAKTEAEQEANLRKYGYTK